jgi:hypothetical protein
MEADVAGEFSGSGHDHICLSVGLGQAHLLHQTAEVGGQADPEQALGLAALELRFRAAGKIGQDHGQG